MGRFEERDFTPGPKSEWLTQRHFLTCATKQNVACVCHFTLDGWVGEHSRDPNMCTRSKDKVSLIDD